MALILTITRSLRTLFKGVCQATVTGAKKTGDILKALRNRFAILDLAECDERTLKDLGLSRSQVTGALAVGYAEDPSALLQRQPLSSPPRKPMAKPREPCPILD